MKTQQIWLSSSTPRSEGEVSGSSLGHTKDLKRNGTYCSSACAGHNELE
jgi:hypothetical protein